MPTVAIVTLATGWTLTLGIDSLSGALPALSLFVASLSLGTGRTNVLQGATRMELFAACMYLDRLSLSRSHKRRAAGRDGRQSIPCYGSAR